MLGWSRSGFFERESYRLLTARRVPRNWGQQDRNYSHPLSTVICARARKLPEPPQDRTIKDGFKPDAGCWNQSTEPGDYRSLWNSKGPGTAVLAFKCKCHLRESVLFCECWLLIIRAQEILPGIWTWRKASGGWLRAGQWGRETRSHQLSQSRGARSVKHCFVHAEGQCSFTWPCHTACEC